MENLKVLPKRGVSLYSYSGEYGVSMQLEDCLMDMNDMGATGLEILANGHVENYPNPSDEWVNEWFRLMKLYDIVPVEYGHWVDSRRYPGRELTTQESYESLVTDIKLASKLGFTIMRTKLGVIDYDLNPVSNWREFIRMALPVAEEYGVVMCPEIHQPTALKSKMVDDYIDFIKETGTKNFALNIDFGVFQTSDRIEIPGQENLPVSPQDLIDVLPYTQVFHAKFTHMTDEFIDPTHPNDEIIAILLENNWKGYLLSEYEGENKEILGYASDQLRKHHVMMKKYLGEI